MAEVGKRLRLLVSAVNLCWAAWAIGGGIFFLRSRETLGTDSTFSVFHSYVHGYEAVGISLVICGVVSLFSLCWHTGQKTAAILCGMWCFVVAGIIQFASPAIADQGDIDAWLLVMCGVSCVGRWALLVMEPYVCE